MAEQLKLTKTLIQAVALVFFVLQMVLAVQHYLARPTMRSPGTKPLSTFKKLIQISVCKASQFNNTYGYDIGYKNTLSYLAGLPNDETIYSWTGLQGNLTFDESIGFLYKSDTENIDFLDSLYFNNIIGNITTKFLVPHGICKIYQGKSNNVKDLVVIIKDYENEFEYFVFVSDPAAANSFQLKNSQITGDSMKLETDKGFYIEYSVQLKETSIETDDKSCDDYPNKKHSSYADCVDDEMIDIVVPTLGCMVPWMSKKDHCAHPFHRLPKHENLMKWLHRFSLNSFGGIPHNSLSCPIPCNHFSAHSKFQISGTENYYRGVYLHFQEHVAVEQIVLAYDSTSLLVEIGSCLGLWLGLSVVGVYDLLVFVVHQSQELFKIRFFQRKSIQVPQ